MPPHDPAAALAAGLDVVTPNNRLARTLIARHDAAMVRAGRRTWAAAHALPWSAWLATLWREALAEQVDAAAVRLLSAVEADYLWQEAIGDDPAVGVGLLDARAAARLAAEAWQLVHAWGAGGESWRAWRGTASAPAGSDIDNFARWAARYHSELGERRVVDLAKLADVLAASAPHMAPWRGRAVLLAGFIEFSPQQERLLTALRAAGMRVDVAAGGDAVGAVERVVAPSARDELLLALRWARARVEADASAFVGIALHDLAERREEARALAEEVLCPTLQMPGREDAARPYDISLGKPLADDPVAAAALTWIALAHGEVSRAEAAALFRSPFAPGEWTARAGSELAWLRDSRARVTWADAAATLSRMMPDAASRMRDAHAAVVLARSQSPREWVSQWRALLSRAGWPGDAPLTGRGFEAQQAFDRALEDFARIGQVEARLRPHEALGALRDVAARTIFQPQGPAATVVIVGMLEAASITFDALWIAGMSSQQWPPPPRPNPLLPIAWQRERGVPRSSAARELAFARNLTQRLVRCAPVVVASAPAVLADFPTRPSALIEGEWRAATAQPATDGSVARIAAAKAIEWMRDDRAPPLAPGDVAGGAGAIAAQSDCPFKAMAQYRLRVEPWPDAAEGLSPSERGQLVHAMMAAFWNGVVTHDALLALDATALRERIDAAAQAALREIPSSRWQALPPVIASAEALRLPEIAAGWIEGFERPRPPFTVVRAEAKGTVELGGLTFRLKLDRVDRLSDGSHAIIDYKTGLVDSTKTWFTYRPRAPQLGVYLLALEAETPPLEVSAVAYGRLKAGELEVLGIGAHPQTWPALEDAAKREEPAGWTGIVHYWRERLPAIATELREGVATVTPRGPKNPPCRVCRRQPLCRIRATVHEGADAGATDE
jgi:probable DNA repair protein